MKARLFGSFLVASVLIFGAGAAVYGSDLAKALATESARYGGLNPRYALVAIGVILASYAFGYVATKSKLV